MPANLLGSSVVIVADQFNPSIFSQLWLVRNNIIAEDAFRNEDCVFTSQIAKIEANFFGLLVIPPQLQFVPRIPDEDEPVLVATKVGGIVRTLPHIPYTAVGLNFTWHAWPDDGTARQLARDLFYIPDSPVSLAVGDDPDLDLGAHFSRPMLGGRLRLDIKPITVVNDGVDECHLQLSFNFQVDLGEDNRVGMIEKHLEHWREAKVEAARISNAVLGGG